MLTADKIAGANADSGTKIKVNLLASDEGEKPLVVFQGNAAALRMMSDFFLAMSQLTEPSDFWANPDNPGAVLFASGSDIGFYIDRTD
jgi:hypothetical protein